MKIEYATAKDSDELAKIDSIAHSELTGWTPNNKLDFDNIIKKQKQIIILAKEKNNLLGYFSLRKDKESNWLWLEDMYVLQKWRKKGIAHKLIKEVLNYHSKNASKRILVLLTSSKNIIIFKKLGFNKTMNFMEYSR